MKLFSALYRTGRGFKESGHIAVLVMARDAEEAKRKGIARSIRLTTGERPPDYRTIDTNNLRDREIEVRHEAAEINGYWWEFREIREIRNYEGIKYNIDYRTGVVTLTPKDNEEVRDEKEPETENPKEKKYVRFEK